MNLDPQVVAESLGIITSLLSTAAGLQQKVAAGTITKADNDAAMIEFDTVRNKFAADIKAAESSPMASIPGDTTPVGTPPTALT